MEPTKKTKFFLSYMKNTYMDIRWHTNSLEITKYNIVQFKNSSLTQRNEWTPRQRRSGEGED